MPVYMNFVCEKAPNHGDPVQHPPTECDRLAPLNFDTLEETWGSMLDFIRSHGWTIEGGPAQTTIKCLCPKHKDEGHEAV